jgi:uncharacterized damage-inducible protein DinB
MNDDLRLLYSWVRGSRERVFAWLESLPPGVLATEHPDFAYGSLRTIQAHVADCYLLWVGRRGLGLGQDEPWIDASSLKDVAALRELFQKVDDVLATAFGRFSDLDAPMTVPDGPYEPLHVTQRWLIMHPVTHEFHHKGQMLALGRVLGHPYPPGPDTDLALP